MKTGFRTFALLLSVLLSAASAADVPLVLQQGKKGYEGTQDVSIASDGRVKDRNFGGRKMVHLWPEGDSIFIRFDLSLIPQSATVKQASLELSSQGAGFSKEEIDRAWSVSVYECRHEWVEGSGGDEGMVDGKIMRDGATFDTFNGKDAWPNRKATSVAGESMGSTILQGPEHKWYKWDLKSKVVPDWISGSRPNHGFIIFGTPPGKAAPFTSSESDQTDKRPILRLTLSLPDSDVAKLGGLAASDIAWPQFVADCGRKAQEANEARTEKVFEEKYLYRTVLWTGTVDSTKRKPIGGGYYVNVRMDPTESGFGTYDLTLSVPDGLTDKILSLNKGQLVDFTAKFSRQGGLIMGHQLDLLAIEETKPPERPQRNNVTPPRRKRRQ